VIKNIIVWDRRKPREKNLSYKVAVALRHRFHVKLYNDVMTKKQYHLVSKYKKSETFMIIVEPGDLKYSPGQDVLQWLFPVVDGQCVLTNIPFAILWCGTNYRIDNHSVLKNVSHKISNWLKSRRNYYNTLTDYIWLATEDLKLVDKKGIYIGQPYPFPKVPVTLKEKDDIVLHIASKDDRTDYYKGTNRIVDSLNQLEMKIDAEVLSDVTHDYILTRLRKCLMYVMTITKWPSGTGYSGIEALANGCLVFSKTPDSDTGIKTPIIHVDDEFDLTNKIFYYYNHKTELRDKRNEQFLWARKMFDEEEFANRVWGMLNGYT